MTVTKSVSNTSIGERNRRRCENITGGDDAERLPKRYLVKTLFGQIFSASEKELERFYEE
jgi:hypothetical protein